MSRHKTESVLLNSYVAARKERQRELVEKVSERVLKGVHSLNAHSMHLPVKSKADEPVTRVTTEVIKPHSVAGEQAFDSRRLHHVSTNRYRK